MAPIRRYLRITKYSVLECRIYLDNPALAQSWLLNPRNPILPKVIQSVRPLVLPKLREEKERALSRKKSKKKGIKDVVVEDEFEVSIFLTETETRHSLLTKHKQFFDKSSNKLASNSSKLISETNDKPVDVENEVSNPITLREESDDEAGPKLDNIPSVDEVVSRSRRSKRGRATEGTVADSDEGEESDELFVGSASEGDSPIEVDSDDPTVAPPNKKRKKGKTSADGKFEFIRPDEDEDDKKKLAMDISFEGFAIYGRVLCLVVKKREGTSRAAVKAGKAPASSAGEAVDNRPGGQAMMENWISSTQMPNPGAEQDVS